MSRHFLTVAPPPSRNCSSRNRMILDLVRPQLERDKSGPAHHVAGFGYVEVIGYEINRVITALVYFKSVSFFLNIET
jgi:hypothetical protein